MADRIRKEELSKTSAAIAKLALARGWAPVPLKHRSKQPAGGDGWNRLKITPDQVSAHFLNGGNVGILWGSPSGWAIDVDLDCEEVVAAARFFLPETYVYGHTDRPCSHFIYTSIDAKNKKWRDDEKASIIEIRSTGSQSAWVGSTHPDGGTYRVDNDVDVAELSFDEVRKICGQLAAVALLARHYPHGGGRHDYVHAVSGALLRDGYEPELVRKIIRGILAATRHEDDLEQRMRTFENTVKAVAADSNTYGWKTLAEDLPSKVLDLIQEYLKESKYERAPDVVIIDSRKGDQRSAPASKFPPLPPGLTADLALWAKGRAYVECPELDAAAALMCTALASGNRYKMADWNTPLQPYIMVLAPTAGGKDSTMQTVYDFARRIDLRDNVFRAFLSYHAMLDKLAEEPSIACWLWDEAARKIKSAARAQSGQDYQILTHLLELYGKAISGMSGSPARNNPIPALDHPFFLTLAMAQGIPMVEAITQEDVATGLVARFLLLDTGEGIRPLNDRRKSLFPSSIDKYVRKFRDVELPSAGFIQVQYGPKVHAFIDEYRHQAHARTVGEQYSELWGRAFQNALIIAGLLAVGRDVNHPVVTMDLALYATELSTRSILAWIARLTSGAAGKGNEKLVRQIEDLIKNAAKYSHRARKKGQEAAMMRKGFMPLSVVKRMVRFDRRRDIEDAIKILLESEMIKQGMKDGMLVLWSI